MKLVLKYVHIVFNKPQSGSKKVHVYFILLLEWSWPFFVAFNFKKNRPVQQYPH